MIVSQMIHGIMTVAKQFAYSIKIFSMKDERNLEDFARIGADFYQKALKAVSANDNKTAIQALEYAVKNCRTNFDINFLLGKLYFEEKQYIQSMIYLKQAHCLDKKSLDVLERLSTVMLTLGDFTSAYCCLKRILPLVINNQKEYLEIANEYIKNKKVDGIRISTRPDYINKEILKMLKKYKSTTRVVEIDEVSRNIPQKNSRTYPDLDD